MRLRYKILPDGAASGRRRIRARRPSSTPSSLSRRRPASLPAARDDDRDTTGRSPTLPATQAETEEAHSSTRTPASTGPSVEAGGVTIYYYSGSDDDAEAMHDVAVESIARMSDLLGRTVDSPCRSGSTTQKDDMRPALPRRSATYEARSSLPASASLRTPSSSSANASFDTLRHELTTSSRSRRARARSAPCPPWLDEGTAVYGQNDPGGFGDAIEQRHSTAATSSPCARSPSSPATRAR